MKLQYILRTVGRTFAIVIVTVIVAKFLFGYHFRKPVHTVSINSLMNNNSARTIISRPYLSVFSVIAVNVTLSSLWDIYAVSMWIEPEQRTRAKCCYLLNNRSVTWRKYLRINYRENMFDYVAQVECPNLLDLPYRDSATVVGITVSVSGTCPNNREWYVTPQYPIQPPSHGFKLALCSKIVYGDLDISLTIEWMEYNKHMGVDRVLLYTYNTSTTVTALLQYYEDKGFLTLIPYRLPFLGYEDHKVGAKTTEAWNDEQIVVYDCQIRLRSYDFVAIIDLDELIVPVMDRNFEIMLERLMYLLPNMGAAEVYGEMYVLDWTRTNPSDPLLVTQYRHRTNSSKPVDINQRKLIHISSRIERGSVVTHGLKTLNDSYLIFKDPMSIMVINHYRVCVSFRDDCYTRQKVYDERIIRHIVPKLVRSIDRVKRDLNTFTPPV